MIFGHIDHLKIVNDATAMRSVFYAPGYGVAASHALLVEESLGGTIVRSQLPVQHGYPGNRTPFSRTNVLTPNTHLDLARSRLERFWPAGPVRRFHVEDAAMCLVEQAESSLRAAAQDHDLRLALTAGLDSRVLLAFVLHTGISVETYTYGAKNDTAVDRAFAHDLAQHAGVPHSTIPNPGNWPVLRQRLARAHYLPHHVNVVQGLMSGFSTTLHLRSQGTHWRSDAAFTASWKGVVRALLLMQSRWRPFIAEKCVPRPIERLPLSGKKTGHGSLRLHLGSTLSIRTTNRHWASSIHSTFSTGSIVWVHGMDRL